MIDREGFGELVERERCLYHLMREATPAKVSSVLEYGLERTSALFVGKESRFWESRSGHVYIGRPEIVRKLFRNYHVSKDWAIFSVDLSKLEPEKINPDEDHLALSTTKHGLKVMQRFRLPVSPLKWAWDWAAYLGIRPPPSLGEWAEAINLGADPATTRYSGRCGSLAYRGVVPPVAIRLHRTDVPCDS